jgi:hypothetical protein
MRSAVYHGRTPLLLGGLKTVNTLLSRPRGYGRGHTVAIATLTFALCSFAILASSAQAAYSILDFQLTPSTKQAGGHPKTHYHVDPDAAGADRTGGDDLKKIVLDYPAGLLGNPEAASPKCSSSLFATDSCPSSSYIGPMVVKWRETSGAFSSANGSVYVLDPPTPGSAITVGFIVRPSGIRKIFLKTEVTGVVAVRTGTEADYGLTLTVDNIPRSMTTNSGVTRNVTISDIAVDINAKANANQSGKYFTFNPTRCTAANSQATISSYQGAVVAKKSSFTPTGCTKVPFTPTASVTPSNAIAGQSTGMSASFTVPTADATIQNSHVRIIQTDLPAGTGLDFPAIGAVPALCSDAELNADSCPAGSKIGSVSANVPFLPPTMTGDVYMVTRGTSVVFGYILRGANGVKAPLKGQVTTVDADGDGAADFVRATAINMPQAPWSTATINFSSPLVINPVTCGSHTVTTKLTGWSGAVATKTNSFALSCPPPETAITAYAPPSAAPSSAVAVTFTGSNSAAFECRLDSASFAPCASPWSLPINALTGAAGHTYDVRAVSNAGVDPTPARGHIWVDDRPYNAAASTTALPNSLVTTAAAADDAGQHPNIAANLDIQGYDDPRNVSFKFPDGLAISLPSVPLAGRCSAVDPDGEGPSKAPWATGDCPESALIGSVSAVATHATDGTVVSAGKLYLVDAPGLSPTSTAGVALDIDGGIYALGQLSMVDQARNFKLTLSDLPRLTSVGERFHLRSLSVTVDGDTGGAANPLITNPHFCAATFSSRPDQKRFTGNVSGHDGSLTPNVTAAYAVDNCTAVPFNPTFDISISDGNAGHSTAITTDTAIPSDHSPISAVSIKLPPFIGPNYPAYGTVGDKCPHGSFTNVSPLGTVPQHLTFNKTSCPPQSRVGTATVETQLFDGPLKGDVYLIDGSPIPYFGIDINPSIPGNPQGVNVGLVGTPSLPQYLPATTSDPPEPGRCNPDTEICAQSVALRFAGLPDLPISSINLQLGGTNQNRTSTQASNHLDANIWVIASAGDEFACHNNAFDAVATFNSWSGSTATRSKRLQPICPGPPPSAPSVQCTPNASAISCAWTLAGSPWVSTTCELDSGPASPCSSPVTFSSLAQGNHLVEVCFSTMDGIVDCVAKHAIVDDTPPVVTIYAPADNFHTARSTVGVAYNVEDISSVTCDKASGSSTPLAVGSNVITVTCTDTAGNVGSDSVTGLRDAPMPAPDPSCSFTASTAECNWTTAPQVTSTTCQLDSGPAESCAPPKSYSALSGPLHSFTLCFTDVDGNSTCKSIDWIVDDFSETVVTQYAGPGASNAAQNVVTFTTSNGEPSSFECRVDNGAWTACASPWTLPNLSSPAEHAYEVRSIGVNGADPTPVKGYVWIDDRAYNATASVTPQLNSLTTVAGTENDAGRHPNISATLALEGYDDPKTVNVAMPDGLMGSLKAVPKASRCSGIDPDGVGPDKAPWETGACPAASQIGTLSATATTSTDGTVSVSTGKLFLVDAPGLPSQYAAGIALSMQDIVGNETPNLGDVNGIGYLSINDQGRNLKISVTDAPRQTSTGVRFHVRSVSLTINGDTGGAANPLLTNPHFCGVVFGSRPDQKRFYGTGVGYNGSVTPKVIAPYVVDNCAAVAFSPTVSYALSNPQAEATTAITADVNVPFDHSPIRGLTVKLPPFVAPGFPSFGVTSDQCPHGSQTNVSPAGTTPQYLSFTPTSCPPQARVGLMRITSPSLDNPLWGDVYLINASPIPYLGIDINPNVQVPAGEQPNPQGVTIGLVGLTTTLQYLPTTTSDPAEPGTCNPELETCAQSIQASFTSLPDVPIANVNMQLGGVNMNRVSNQAGNPALDPNVLVVAAAGDTAACQNAGFNAVSTFNPWRGTPTAVRNNLLQPTGCDQ